MTAPTTFKGPRIANTIRKRRTNKPVLNYPTQTDNVNEATTYNGWTNYETWNVALYINNEYDLYRAACSYVSYCKELQLPVSYVDFTENFRGQLGKMTPDGVSWTDFDSLDTAALDEMLTELVDLPIACS